MNNNLYPLFSLLLLILPITTQDKTYSQFKLISNKNHYDKVLFIDKLNIALLYGQSNKNVSAYHTYNWVVFSNSNYTDFFFAPNYMEVYRDKENDVGIVFSNTNGKIRKKWFNSTGEGSEMSLWTIT